jgi:hypothetical protein
MSGAQLPTTVTTQATGSPLSAIAGLGSLGVGLLTKNAQGVSPWDGLSSTVKDALLKLGITDPTTGSTAATGGANGGNMTSTGFTDASGNALISNGSGGFTDTEGNLYDSSGTKIG